MLENMGIKSQESKSVENEQNGSFEQEGPIEDD
jgi:hypothetical protein